jgi:hypothetical protein
MRTKSYIGTFQNTPEGIEEYKDVVNSICLSINQNIKFVKMFRGGKRNKHVIFEIGKKKVFSSSGGCLKNGSTHFDAYRRD